MKIKLLLGLVMFLCTTSGQSKEKVKKPPVKRIDVGKNISVELEGVKAEARRVVIDAYVCNRECPLELLVTKRHGKEHESILAAEIDASQLHAALLLAGAVAGKPVQFKDGKALPPTGSAIKIFFEFKDKKGKLQRVPAQHWVRDVKTRKEMKADFVFAGSVLMNRGPAGQAASIYAANLSGNLICLANFEDAAVDVPVLSTTDNDNLVFETWTERIPPKDTPVRVVLEAVPPKKK
jgi:hypothetical protein